MGGRGASSGILISELGSLRKSVTSAKRAESKAYTDFLKAQGAERMTPTERTDLRAKRREETTKAHEKYVSAEEKRIKLETQLDKIKKKIEKRNSKYNTF